MPKFSNSKLVGACELWQPEFSVSASDDNSMDGTATFISASPECPLAFGAPFPFPGFSSLRLTEYDISNFGGGLYQINCTFKGSTTEGSTGGDNAETGGTYSDGDKEEAETETWTLTGGLETRPLSDHPNYKKFNAKEIEEKFAILADGKLDVQAFFEHGVAIPVNPNDVNFDPSTYSGLNSVMNLDSDFLQRLIKGNTIYFAPVYNATINNVGQPKQTAFGLSDLIQKLGITMEVTSQNTVKENGIERSSTTLQEVKQD